MIDLLICVALVAGLLWGYRRGIVRQIGSLVAIIAAFAVCRLLGGPFGRLIARLMDADAGFETDFVAPMIGHVLLFVVVWFGVSTLAKALHTIVKAVHLGVVNNFAGALFMAFKVVIVAGILLNIFMAITDTPSDSVGGPIAEMTSKVAPELMGYVKANF